MQNDTLSHLEARAIRRAITIFEKRFTTNQEVLTSPEAVKNYLRLRIGALEHEEFHVLWLNTQNKLIAVEKLFTGTLTRTEIHPRELVKSALANNAASAIFAHNHPSGKAIASAADLELTENLKAILSKIEVRVLDHVIVTALEAASLSEQGRI